MSVFLAIDRKMHLQQSIPIKIPGIIVDLCPFPLDLAKCKNCRKIATLYAATFLDYGDGTCKKYGICADCLQRPTAGIMANLAGWLFPRPPHVGPIVGDDFIVRLHNCMSKFFDYNWGTGRVVRASLKKNGHLSVRAILLFSRSLHKLLNQVTGTGHNGRFRNSTSNRYNAKDLRGLYPEAGFCSLF